MIDASPFSLLDHAISFARQLWFKESRIQSWLDAFSGDICLTDAIGHVPASLKKERNENSLVVELDIAAWEKFKLIEHGLERLWERISRDKIQKASEEPGELVPDSIEKEDVVSSDSSDEVDSADRKTSMLSYDLNKMPEYDEYLYSRMTPEKTSAWHLAIWAKRYLEP
ncbi:hypothetical protein Ahy_B03g065510 [Arachis hypogaea]|uniref:Oxo-4-hydroxy-4-carboxy-5-ureidoimidazoline decarboxylase domain-containing protein n=1 Tax=Arachis hypogaea TaxID=3818 RepID=A0A445A1T4_ARAHY|nr:hypothetical protein Ahy_B03g065510 [Arachis hypogaea]